MCFPRNDIADNYQKDSFEKSKNYRKVFVLKKYVTKTHHFLFLVLQSMSSPLVTLPSHSSCQLLKSREMFKSLETIALDYFAHVFNSTSEEGFSVYYIWVFYPYSKLDEPQDF